MSSKTGAGQSQLPTIAEGLFTPGNFPHNPTDLGFRSLAREICSANGEWNLYEDL
jgi:hypothetical protein